MYYLLHLLILYFHLGIVIFNLFGWILPRTRRAHLLVLGVTLFSWLALGAFYGWGYCFLTDWHWYLLRELGERDLPRSYLVYLVKYFTGAEVDTYFMDYLAAASLTFATTAAAYVNIRDYRKIRRRASAVIIHKNKILLVEMLDTVSKQKFWVPPGGRIEPGETPMATAIRETFEETGYSVKIDPAQKVASKYIFNWLGKDRPCYTEYYMASIVEGTEPSKPTAEEDYILQSRWVDLADWESVVVDHQAIKKALRKLISNN